MLANPSGVTGSLLPPAPCPPPLGGGVCTPSEGVPPCRHGGWRMMDVTVSVDRHPAPLLKRARCVLPVGTRIPSSQGHAAQPVRSALKKKHRGRDVAPCSCRSARRGARSPANIAILTAPAMMKKSPLSKASVMMVCHRYNERRSWPGSSPSPAARWAVALQACATCCARDVLKMQTPRSDTHAPFAMLTLRAKTLGMRLARGRPNTVESPQFDGCPKKAYDSVHRHRRHDAASRPGLACGEFAAAYGLP
mmetsp:Transcript_45722/g.143037  ORF Transcript_45722/g.143037 Transcript_45722/m.143037 type:complete len:250 (-) Transcript_45722:909-1658(-)